jgi:predicted AlkP superfamily pyrophosphatase or phosphodiesterase
MAKEAIKAENLGGGTETDFLAVSFSSPDYIGHAHGPNSVEQEDDFLRLIKNSEIFLMYWMPG